MMILLNDHMSTSQITQEINSRTYAGTVTLTDVRRELISLHHHGCIKTVGVRRAAPWTQESDGARPILYWLDRLWTISNHGRNHDQIVANCQACERRQSLLLRMGAAAEPSYE